MPAPSASSRMAAHNKAMNGATFPRPGVLLHALAVASKSCWEARVTAPIPCHFSPSRHRITRSRTHA
eukprot:2533078-Alexandrium_andersonii.AAC.1